MNILDLQHTRDGFSKTELPTVLASLARGESDWDAQESFLNIQWLETHPQADSPLNFAPC